MVAYVASRGMHQPFRVDEANLVLTTKTSADICGASRCRRESHHRPECGEPPKPINRIWLNSGMFYEGHSYYNAFEAQLASE